MAVVTITGHAGSFAGEIASRVAHELGYAMADRELMIEGAAALGWTEQEVEEFGVRTRGLGPRLMELLSGVVGRRGAEPEEAAGAITQAGGLEAVLRRTYGEASESEMRAEDQLYIEALRALLYSFAERGDVVLVGRGSQAILAGWDDALHVRVVCALEERVRRLAERRGASEDVVLRRVRESDRARESWHRKYFDIDYRSPYHYHLVLNSGRLADDLSAHLIVRAVREREPRPG